MTKHSKSLPKAKPSTTGATATNTAKPSTTNAMATNTAKPATTSATATNTAKRATTGATATNTAKLATTNATATNTAKRATTNAMATNTAKPATTSAPATNTAKPATTSAPATDKAKPATTSATAQTKAKPVTASATATTAKKKRTSEQPGQGQSATPAGRFTIGLDLGDRSTAFCVLDTDGAIVAEGKLKTTQAAIDQQFASLAPARVALEAGTHSGWISRLIESYGHEVIVANPREVRKIYQNDRKNDRSDAQILARLARFDPQLLEPIRHRTAPMQADLATIRARETLVTARTKCVNAMRGLVKSMGGRLPKCSTESFCKRVSADVPPELETALRPLITAIQTLNEQIRCCDVQIETLATEIYPQTALPRQVSGVGALTALAFILTIADGGRFAKSRDIGPYLGLVPRQDDSGDHSSQLRITKAGDPYLRRLLVGSAQYIVGPFGPDTDLRRHGERLMQRGGKNAKKRAIVAVARKLAVLLHRLWVTGEVYQPLRNSNRQASMKAA
jgi:transposase